MAQANQITNYLGKLTGWNNATFGKNKTSRYVWL